MYSPTGPAGQTYGPFGPALPFWKIFHFPTLGCSAHSHSSCKAYSRAACKWANEGKGPRVRVWLLIGWLIMPTPWEDDIFFTSARCRSQRRNAESSLLVPEKNLPGWFIQPLRAQHFENDKIDMTTECSVHAAWRHGWCQFLLLRKSLCWKCSFLRKVEAWER